MIDINIMKNNSYNNSKNSMDESSSSEDIQDIDFSSIEYQPYPISYLEFKNLLNGDRTTLDNLIKKIKNIDSSNSSENSSSDHFLGKKRKIIKNLVNNKCLDKLNFFK